MGKRGEGHISPDVLGNDAMYAKSIKRILDITLALAALIGLSPLLLILTAVGAIEMRGNPFFSQERPGWHERAFKIYKFRTMTDERGADGKLLPDEARLKKYGRFLRSTSLDELPELWNILRGDMSVVGPRPLLTEYLPWYTAEEHRRHCVRPGLTGWAQIKGRNNLDWDRRFEADVYYVDHISFRFDMSIFFSTVMKVLLREDVIEDTRTVEPNFASQRYQQAENSRMEIEE